MRRHGLSRKIIVHKRMNRVKFATRSIHKKPTIRLRRYRVGRIWQRSQHPLFHAEVGRHGAVFVRRQEQHQQDNPCDYEANNTFQTSTSLISPTYPLFPSCALLLAKQAHVPQKVRYGRFEDGEGSAYSAYSGKCAKGLANTSSSRFITL